MSHRVGVSAMRHLAAKNNTAFFSHNLPRLAVAARASSIQIRTAATTPASTETEDAILKAQRLKRPISPHLAVYDVMQTWGSGSIWNRFTGTFMSGGLYLFATAYLVAPLTGWHLESASLVAAFAGMSVAVKSGIKFFLAWPFVYHVINSVKHMVWDFGIGFKKSGLYTIGWSVWAASVLGAAATVAFI